MRAKLTRKTKQQDDFTKGYPAFCPSGRLRRSKIFPIYLWEGRFKTQALLDEAALAACMAYVDLNPIRAKMAATPETSDFTSAQRRLMCLKQTLSEQNPQQPPELLPFVSNPREPMPDGLPFKLEDYLELVDWSGRIVRESKRGAIAANTPPILERLGLTEETWQQFEKQFMSKSALCFSCLSVAQELRDKFRVKRLRLAG